MSYGDSLCSLLTADIGRPQHQGVHRWTPVSIDGQYDGFIEIDTLASN